MIALIAALIFASAMALSLSVEGESFFSPAHGGFRRTEQRRALRARRRRQYTQ